MPIAALYDIHANLPAFEAVLHEIRHLDIAEIVIGGDILPGPMPRETLDLLRTLDLPTHFIYGNGEVAVLEQMSGRDPAAVPAPHRPAIRWNAEQLDGAAERFIASWPKTISLKLPS